MPSSAEIKQHIAALEGIARWPEMLEIVQRGGGKRPGSIACWEYPQLACEAVGGDPCRALPAMAAVACLLNGIHLLDDLLDEDPDGLQHTLGVGTTANIAAAFQAAASRIVVEARPTDPEAHPEALRQVAAAALDTAWGQHLDTRDLGDRDPETAYWTVTAAKTPPLFAAALALGALYGGADVETARRIATLAQPIAKVIQSGDDMTDALSTPAKPDWQSRWNNLVILFAQTAEHPQRRRFLELLDLVDSPEALTEAQRILVSCGAVSFGCYHVIEGYREACRLLADLQLPHPAALGRLLESLVQPSRELFAKHDIEIPAPLRELEAWRQ